MCPVTIFFCAESTIFNVFWAVYNDLKTFIHLVRCLCSLVDKASASESGGRRFDPGPRQMGLSGFFRIKSVSVTGVVLMLAGSSPGS